MATLVGQEYDAAMRSAVARGRQRHRNVYFEVSTLTDHRELVPGAREYKVRWKVLGHITINGLGSRT